MKRWALLIGTAMLPGCLTVPSYPEPQTSAEKNATFEPGFGANQGTLARWTCLPEPSTEAVGMSPRVDLRLEEHPTRGLVLHDVTNDMVMPIAATTPEGTRFHTYLDGEKSVYLVPTDRKLPVTREWLRVTATDMSSAGLLVDLIVTAATTKKALVKQQCAAGPLVRFL